MSESDFEAQETVDARGAACPGPLMDLIGKIRGVDPGTVVLLLSDNEQSKTDVPEWAEESGNEVLGIEERDDHYAFYVEKT
ncbi:sulfurtransferase TusA family protein [Halobellus marinus]|jgi:TusA-related sulfurtransferase|uniref:sulfurtransferase TusA family protein n=1 Tax=Halobellus TaxID=1073986 RepID=UPI0028AD2171|nr:sulfurtransferase TusA family protein [Halobellus sp. DFY28]